MSQPIEQALDDYSPKDRRADLRRGRLDGRKRVPSYTHLATLIDEMEWFTTPYTEELWEVGHDRMQAELIDYRRRTAPKQERLAGLRERLVAVEEAVQHGLTALEVAAAELTPAELLPRNPQEVGRSADFLRSRRTVMRERRIQAEQKEHDKRVAAVDELKQLIAEACQDLDQEFAKAKERACHVADHVKVRVATYWGAVTSTHSQGRQLALILPNIRSVIPPWLSASSRCGVIVPTAPEDPDGNE
jgi:hypothetical protein